MQARLFAEGTVPEHATPGWYADRERAPHLEQGGHVGRLHRAAAYVETAVVRGAHSVVDLGAGDGGLLSILPGALPKWGYDLQPTNIAGALERGVVVELANVLDDPIVWADCAVATEMLEHLVDPHGFVRTIAGQARWLVASSPAFETEESHYAFHLWAFDQDGYRELVEQAGFTVVKHTVISDFQVLLAERA